MKTIMQQQHARFVSSEVTVDVQQHLNEQSKIILKQKGKIAFLEVSSKSSI